MIYEKKLKNGIRLVVNQMEGLFSVSAGILVGTGSAFERDEEDGISHFIEHMQFKGTTTKNAFQISDSFDRIGAQVNAFTGKEMTCYYVKATSEHIAEGFSYLADLFLNATYPEDEMVREKGVIREEIAMNEDTPEDLCFDVLGEAMFGKSTYGRNILGSVENVNGFTKADVDKYKEKTYRADNIVLSFAGGIDFSLAEELAEKFFSDFRATEKGKNDKTVLIGTSSLVRKKPIEQIHIAIGYPAFSRKDLKLESLNAASAVLGGSMSSRLFQVVREKLGLAYSVYSYVSAYEECGAFGIYAGVNPKNARKAYEAIGDCVKELVEKGVSDEELSRSLEQMKSSMLFSQESTSAQMLLFGKEMLFENKLFDFENKLKTINNVTKESLLEAVSLTLGTGKRAVGVVGNIDQSFEI